MMKIFEAPPPVYIVRLAITKAGWKQAMYINLCDTTPDEAEAMVKHVISELNISPFEKGRVTSITIRESKGKNGKSKSVSFKGVEVVDAYMAIKNFLFDENKLKSWSRSLQQ